MEGLTYINEKLLLGASAFIIPIETFYDNNNVLNHYKEVPFDIEFQSIQGFIKLSACFWSNSKENAYWWELPYKLHDIINIENRKFRIINVEIVSTLNKKSKMKPKGLLSLDRRSMLNDYVISSILVSKKSQHHMKAYFNEISELKFEEDVFVAYYEVKEI